MPPSHQTLATPLELIACVMIVSLMHFDVQLYSIRPMMANDYGPSLNKRPIRMGDVALFAYYTR